MSHEWNIIIYYIIIIINTQNNNLILNENYNWINMGFIAKDF